MLRLAILVLVLANAVYFGWSAGWLAPWGLGPTDDAEPQRLQQQITPERIELLPRSGATSVGPERKTAATASAPAPAPACLQSATLDARQADALRALLADWPAGSWSLQTGTSAARWMVYIGRLADEEALAKKRAELRALKIEVDRPSPAFEPGLSLGRFASEESAQRSLKTLSAQGVKTARVVQERAEQTHYQLRLPAVDDALRPRLAQLHGTLADKPLTACSTP